MNENILSQNKETLYSRGHAPQLTPRPTQYRPMLPLFLTTLISSVIATQLPISLSPFLLTLSLLLSILSLLLLYALPHSHKRIYPLILLALATLSAHRTTSLNKTNTTINHNQAVQIRFQPLHKPFQFNKYTQSLLASVQSRNGPITARIYIYGHQQLLKTNRLYLANTLLKCPKHNKRLTIRIQSENLKSLAHKQTTLIQLRQFASQKLSTLSPNTSSLLQSILIGQRFKLQKHTKTLFRDTGTGHLLAVSGLHVLVLAAMVHKFPIKSLKLPLTLLTLALYVALVGAPASALRASIILSLALIAPTINRSPDSWNLLAFTGLTLLLVDPSKLLDPGAQLSFSIVAAILLHNDLLHTNANPTFTHDSLLKWLAHSLKTFLINSSKISLIAFVVASPITLQRFGHMAPLSLLANSIAVPLFSITLLSGFLGLLLAFIHHFAAWLPFLVSEISSNALLFWLKLIQPLLPPLKIHPEHPLRSPYFPILWISILLIQKRFFPQYSLKTLLILALILVSFKAWTP